MPRTQTITRDVYSFDELAPSAKEKARDWYRECIDANDFDFVIEDFCRVADILGIDLREHEITTIGGKKRSEPNVYWSVGYCQSDHACFEGSYDYKATAPAKIREYAPKDTVLQRIADDLTEVQVRNAFGLRAVFNADRCCMSIDVKDRRNEHRNLGEDHRVICDLIRSLSQWLYRQLREQSDYLYSDENVDEVILANGYEFDEEGGIL